VENFARLYAGTTFWTRVLQASQLAYRTADECLAHVGASVGFFLIIALPLCSLIPACYDRVWVYLLFAFIFIILIG
jgi:hypothetical protein